MDSKSKQDKAIAEPVRLVKVHHESEAGLIMSALALEGIDSNSTGEFTAGLRAETPGMVQIWVHKCNLERARELLQEVNDSVGEVDWSEVDTGDRTPVEDDEKLT
ncbi:MAG: DUF2007 domain-containing protein [Pirellulaceae bacterium]